MRLFGVSSPVLECTGHVNEAVPCRSVCLRTNPKRHYRGSRVDLRFLVRCGMLMHVYREPCIQVQKRDLCVHVNLYIVFRKRHLLGDELRDRVCFPFSQSHRHLHPVHHGDWNGHRLPVGPGWTSHRGQICSSCLVCVWALIRCGWRASRPLRDRTRAPPPHSAHPAVPT